MPAPYIHKDNAALRSTDFRRIMNILVPLIESQFDDVTVEIMRRKSPADRIRLAGQMYQSARVILRGAITTDHPDWTIEEVNAEIAKRISHGLVPDDFQ